MTTTPPADLLRDGGTRRRVSSSHLARVSTILLVALTLVQAIAVPAHAAQGRTYTAGPGNNLSLSFERLKAGDTLLLRPGTYDIGWMRPVLNKGTKDRPITVKAEDWRQPPTLRGGMLLQDPSFWSFHRLRVQAAAPKAPAVHVVGGEGWSVTGSEFFGARDTDAYANVAIDGKDGFPRNFRFADNCVHDAGQSTRWKTDHNMYVKFHGAYGAGGVIERNTIFGHPNGAGIKIGDGGEPGAPGPWGVVVRHNTITTGGRQILLSHDVRNNVVEGNLLTNSTEPFTTTDRRTTATYALMVSGKGNTVQHNYVSSVDMTLRDPYGFVRASRDVGAGPSPAFTRPGSCAMEATYWKARYYGRTSGGKYLAW